MNLKIMALTLALLLSLPTVAGGQPNDPKVNEALRLAKQWKDNPELPVRGDNGKVQYLYGATLPTVVCSPLYACDIALEPGEKVHQVDIGDGVRWKAKPALSGEGDLTQTHIVIKPVEAGLISNLLINTNRRTYTIQLKSAKTDWMPHVSFVYPEALNQLWENYYAQQAADKAALEASKLDTGHPIADLDFNYKISGDKPRWRPLRVYTDGVKTYIQFPDSMQHDESPALLAVGSNEQEQLVNYRAQGSNYIVDKVLREAYLVSGVGWRQKKVKLEAGD